MKDINEVLKTTINLIQGMPEQNGLEKQIAVHFNFEVTYDFWSSYSKSIESETFWGTLGDNAYEDLYIHNC